MNSLVFHLFKPLCIYYFSFHVTFASGGGTFGMMSKDVDIPISSFMHAIPTLSNLWEVRFGDPSVVDPRRV